MNLKELSDHLGLSMTTVSRALNGHSDVAESTKARVRDAARAAGYVPNKRARALATGRAMSIGHVLPLSNMDERVNPIFADFIAGTGETFSEAGFDTLLTMTANQNEEQVYRDIASRRAVDGVVVHSPMIGDARIALLDEIGMPFVVHGRTDPSGQAKHPWVDVNNTAAFAEATERLIGLGHRRIALINGREDRDFAQRRRRGYLRALQAAGIDRDETLMRAGEMTERQGHSAAKEMLAFDAPPTAFLTASIISAIGVRRAMHELGLDCPRDASILTFDDDLSYFTDQSGRPAFAAMRSSVREAGHEAASLLIDLIEGRNDTERHRLLTAEFVDGASLGPAPKT